MTLLHQQEYEKHKTKRHKLRKVKVKIKVKVKFTLEQATKAQSGSRGIALFFNLGARWGWVVNVTTRLLTTGKGMVPIV